MLRRRVGKALEVYLVASVMRLPSLGTVTFHSRTTYVEDWTQLQAWSDDFPPTSSKHSQVFPDTSPQHVGGMVMTSGKL